MATRLFTSESVTEGHPDKICDQISDAVPDAVLRQDPEARAAIECVTKTGFVMIVGELTTRGYVDIAKAARETRRQIGYDDPHIGFDWETCGVQLSISEQSPDISQGVAATDGREQGAGDQGMMFGYACDETPELMPLPIILAHQLTARLADLRKSKALSYLRPNGKSQVTIEYDGHTPLRLHTVVLSGHHTKDVPQGKIRKDLIEHVIRPVCQDWLDECTVFHINPAGQCVVGGPVADSGLSGRKIIVDTYGGYARHGGGAFSGKDPGKVDRSAAYMARHIAKNLVAAGLATRCEIQLAYAIGVAEPVSVLVETFGTGALPEDQLAVLVRLHFPLTPTGIITHLDLKKPIYQQTAAYGHVGRANFSWERLDAVAALKNELVARQSLPALEPRRPTHMGSCRPRGALAHKAA